MKTKLLTLLAGSMFSLSGWAIDANTYYLYNIGAHKWLNFGSEKGMTATFYKTGTAIKLSESGEGYALQCPFYDASNYLGNSGSLTTETAFTITEVSEGVYTIKGANGYLGYDGTTDLDAAPYSNKLVTCTLSDAESDNAHWQLLTKEQLTEQLKAATQDSPMDATFLIQSPNFHRHDAGCYNTSPNGHLVWTNMEGGNHGYSGYTQNYNGFVFNTSNVNIYQDLSGLPSGIYEVRCQGFSRYGSNTDATGTYASTTPQATLYAGEVSTPFMRLTDDLAASGFYDNNKKYGDGYVPYFNNDGGKTTGTSNSEAGKAFDYGMYNKNVVRTEVNDGTLRIGINVPSDARTNTWTAFDNFELVYYGVLTTLTPEQIEAILASVPTGKMEATLQTALDNALAAFNTSKTIENYNALGEAISAAKTSAKAYADIKAALDKADAETLGEAARDQLDKAVADIRKGYDEGTITGDGTAEVAAIEEAIKAAIVKDSEGSADKTALIANPKFDDGKNGWNGDFGTGAVKATSINPLITAYGGTFDIYQDITGLENGTYKLQAQAFSRPMDHDALKTAYANGEALNNQSYLYANEQSTLVKLITDEYGTTSAWGAELASGKYIPNSSNDAANAFNQGLYENELLFIVKDGKARIGIKQTSSEGTPYVGYDNFRLTYISADTELPEKQLSRSELMAILNNYKKVGAQAIEHAAFDAVCAEVETVIKDEAAEEAPTLATLKPVRMALATLLKEGETESGVFDLTPIITNATFDKDIEGWTSENNMFTWNSTGVVQVANSKADDRLSQVLPDMPAGKYTVKVQSFYRPKGWKQALYEYEHNAKGVTDDFMSLGMNNSSTSVKSIFADGRYLLASANISRTEDVGATIDGRGFPHLISKVGDMFKAGHYWNSLTQETTEDGDLTIAFTLSNALADNWGVIDNVRLYYGTAKPITLTSTNNTVKDDTEAEVIIAKALVADSLTAFWAPCDIDASHFKQVYGIGSVDYVNKAVSLYPIDYVHAGVPCYVVPAATTEQLNVGRTTIKAAEADNIVTPWTGDVLIPTPRTYTWKAQAFNAADKLTTIFPSSIKTATIQDAGNMQFTANIQNAQARQFLATKSYTQSAESVISTYNAPVPARRDVAHSVGIPVPSSQTIGAKLHYSLNEDMSDAKTIENTPGQTLCFIPNLVPGNTYFFELDNAFDNMLAKGQFTVEDSHRMLYAPSIYNIRDFGGWTMADGRKTRYGLIYRGGEVNGFHAPYQADVETLKGLGIGAEIDLRYNDSYDQDRETGKSGFGFKKGDTYFFAGANDYTAANLDEAETQARLKQEFRFLLGHIREGRGVYFHCVFGADRTGFFAMLLEGLLGFQLPDLYKDYELTSFAAPAGNRVKGTIQERIAVIQKLTGANLTAKFENYWLNKVGITQDEVDEFRNIMLYDPATVGINAPQPGMTPATTHTLQSVYTLNGTQIPAQSLGSKPGIYVVKYSDGKNKKVVVK